MEISDSETFECDTSSYNRPSPDFWTLHPYHKGDPIDKNTAAKANFSLTQESFTIETKIKANSNGKGCYKDDPDFYVWCNRIISMYYGATDDGFEMYAPYESNGKNGTGFFTHATWDQKFGSSISLNEWHTLALVFNVTATSPPPWASLDESQNPFGNVTVKSYIDCKLDTEFTVEFIQGLNWYMGGAAWIGGIWYEGMEFYYDGDIDYVKIWKSQDI